MIRASEVVKILQDVLATGRDPQVVFQSLDTPDTPTILGGVAMGKDGSILLASVPMLEVMQLLGRDVIAGDDPDATQKVQTAIKERFNDA